LPGAANAGAVVLPARLRMDTKPPDLDQPLRPVSDAVLRQYIDPLHLPGPSYVTSVAGTVARYGSVHVPRSMERDYNEARQYLAAGPYGRRLLATVENRNFPVHVQLSDLHAHAAPEDRINGLEVTVAWDPRAALSSTAGGRMPPAEVLAHEFGHAIRCFRDAEGKNFQNPLSYQPVPSSTNAHERNVIRSSDAYIASEHGNAFPRDDHQGIMYKTTGVASTQALYPEDEAVIAPRAVVFQALTAWLDQRGIDPELVPTDQVKAAQGDVLNAQQFGHVSNWSAAQLIGARQIANMKLQERLWANAQARARAASGAPQNPVGEPPPTQTAAQPSALPGPLPQAGSPAATAFLLAELERVEAARSAAATAFPSTA
jgi:hypothetical protein